MSTEIHFFPNPLPSSGTFNAVVQDNAGVPTDVIEASLEFRVDCEWDIDAITAAILGGEWHVDLYAESLGGGFEGRVGGVALAVVPGQLNYAAQIIVPANTFPNDPSALVPTDQSNVYKMVVVLTHSNGGVTTSLCALQEGPAVLVR
jgi:hypothetical protein